MARAAQVHERLGNLDKAARYRQFVSQRYSDDALNWLLWCLRTGGGDLDEALQFAERTVDDWGSDLSHENHVRAAIVEMVRGDLKAAYARLLPIGRRSRDAFYRSSRLAKSHIGAPFEHDGAAGCASPLFCWLRRCAFIVLLPASVGALITQPTSET